MTFDASKILRKWSFVVYIVLQWLFWFFLKISVADPGCLSRIRIFPSRIQGLKKIPDFESWSASKNLLFVTRNIVSRLSKIWSGMFIPDMELDFFTGSRIQGSKKPPDPGSGSAILLKIHYDTGNYGRNNYKDTKPYMSSLLEFNRAHRLEIQSVMLVFSTPLVKYCLSNLLTRSPPPLPCVNKHRAMYLYRGGGRGDRVVWRAYTGVIHCVFDQTLNVQNCFTTPNKNLPPSPFTGYF